MIKSKKIIWEVNIRSMHWREEVWIKGFGRNSRRRETTRKT
jgi:hypothetical protein